MFADNLRSTVITRIPGKKASPGGWMSLNCPMCTAMGETRPDTRNRGGFNITADSSIVFNCFNCGFNFLSRPWSFDGLAIGPEGLLYAAPYSTNLIEIFDPETKKHVGNIHNVGRITAMVFGPDGLLYAGDSGGNRIDVYQPLTRAELSKKPNCGQECKVGSIQNTGGVTALAFGPDGYLYSGAFNGNQINIWNVRSKDFGNIKKLSIYRNGELLSSNNIYILEPGDQIDIPANMKYRTLGNMSMLQTLTAMMTLYLTFLAVD